MKKTKIIRLPLFLFLFAILACDTEDIRTYELLPAEEEPEMDITIYGTLSVNRENAGGPTAAEGSLKVIDNDYSTKFLINPYYDDLYMQLAFPGGIAVSAYILASANDAPSRDPRNWELLGSNDLESWTTIDSVNDYTFSSRNQQVRFDVENTEMYRYYRLNITAILGGTGLFQMAEWRLIYNPSVLSN